MFKIDDAVFYGVHGVCKIVEISKRELCGKLRDYYTLKPVYSDKSTVFVPVERTDKLRKVLKKSEVLEIVDGLKDAQSIWVDDDIKRKERFSEIVKNGNHKELGTLIKTIYEKRRSFMEIKKKMHLTDERFFEEAEKILYEEFAYALDIPLDQVVNFIEKRINKKRYDGLA